MLAPNAIVFQRSSARIIFLNMYEENAAEVLCLVSEQCKTGYKCHNYIACVCMYIAMKPFYITSIVNQAVNLL